MSCHCEIAGGGADTSFELKDVEGYKKWKKAYEYKDPNLAGLLREEVYADKKNLKARVVVVVGTPQYVFEVEDFSKAGKDIDYDGPDEKELDTDDSDNWQWKTDTYINHFSPWDDGVLDFWAGLSRFTAEPIELLQWGEEFLHLSKIFGADKTDKGAVWRLYAENGKVTVQPLDFIPFGKADEHVYTDKDFQGDLELIKSNEGDSKDEENKDG